MSFIGVLAFQAKDKFARMMSEQREAGVSDEDLKKMVTKEGFEKYKKVCTSHLNVKLLETFEWTQCL